jgi:flagellar M-ring protein FliF
MADAFTNFRENIGKIIRGLTKTQKLIIVLVTVLTISGIILLVILASKPEYGVLFSDLDPNDASKIIDKLTEKNIAYQITNNGRTVNVPKEKVYELRLQLAGEGLPLSGVVGYEIFDKTNFGISDFQQKVNYKRALEGELVRTVMKLESVEAAQIRIVMPEKTLFKEDQKKTTASVILKLRGGRSLTSENVMAINNLVAGSVEGLDPSNVTIIDSKGHLLSSSEPKDALISMSANQYDMKRKVEMYLNDKAQSMLDQVLGTGKSIVRVNAELDFNQSEKTSKTYDPNSVVRSQETNNQSRSEFDSLPPSTKGTTLTNYEVGETVEHLVGAVGNIKRLTVAVLVDGTYRDTEKENQITREFIPRSNEEITKITGVVKSAVGFDDTRKDQLSIENLIFDTNMEEDIVSSKEVESSSIGLVKQLMVVLAMIGTVLLFRSLLKRFRPKAEVKPKLAKIALKSIDEKELRTGIKEPIKEEVKEIEEVIIREKKRRPTPVIELPEEEVTEEELKQNELKNRVTNYVVEKPSEALNLVKIWLLEDENK